MNIFRTIRYYIIPICFITAGAVSFIDSFVRPMGIIANVLWISSFAVYLTSELTEGRRIFPSEKIFSYGFIGLFGLLAIDRWSRENHFAFGESVLVPVYGFIAAPWVIWLAFKLSAKAPDRVGFVKVWLYAVSFGGIMLLMSLLKFRAVYQR